MNETLHLCQEWDKVFPLSEEVRHHKTTFTNRYGITLAADVYEPKKASGKLPGIAISGPFGAVKEQASGLYAHQRKRGYHPRSQGEGKGWNVIGCQSFLNMPILQYSHEIRSAVLMIHGEKAHSCYFSKDAYQKMMDGNPVPDNKELLIIPGAVHTDLYDQMDIIPFDKITDFYQTYLK